MVKQQEGKWVVPNPQVPRTFGMLNIIFGILLLLFGAYSLVMLVIGPKIQNAVITRMKEQQANRRPSGMQRSPSSRRRKKPPRPRKRRRRSDEREALERSVEPDLSAS